MSNEKKSTPIIGRGEAMRALRGLIATVANANASVLISGESGTGKELVARAQPRAGEEVGILRHMREDQLDLLARARRLGAHEASHKAALTELLVLRPQSRPSAGPRRL